MSKLRIAAIVIVLLALAAIALVVARPKPSSAAGAQETWLRTLPGMDASGARSRLELIGSYQLGQVTAFDSQPLVVRCGLNGPDSPHEEYLAHLGDHWFVKNRSEWMVRIVPLGSGTLEVTARDVTQDAPPAPGFREVRDSTRTMLSGSVAERLRAAWNDPDLWSAQSDTQCMDGEIVQVQACISGQYAVRAHPCDAKGAEAGKRLLQTLRASINAPRVQVVADSAPSSIKLESTRNIQFEQPTP